MSVPKDTYELLHFNMIHAHNTFKFGYDKIVAVLDDVPQADLRNFLGYCEAWAISIAEHHDCEEEVVFPLLNAKMDFSTEKEQHKAVHSGVEGLLNAVNAAKTDPAAFNAAELKELMVAFREPLYTHLDDEVEHITADKMRAAGFTEAELKNMISKMEAYAKSHGDPFLQVPYMRSHTPPEFKDCWPPMPWLLRKVVIPYILARRYSGYWKYAPYAMS